MVAPPGGERDTCFALSASTCIVSRLCIDTFGLVWLRIALEILRPALDPPPQLAAAVPRSQTTSPVLLSL